MPGVNIPSGLENTARPRIVPDALLDHVVDEVHVAAVDEFGLVDQLERDDDAAVAAGDLAAAAARSRS